MIPAAFDYLAPTTVDDALHALATGGDDVKVLGGGQSLLPILRMRLNAPEKIVDLGRIEELRGIREDGDPLHGSYAPPCRSCTVMLAHFGVRPVDLTASAATTAEKG